MLPMISFRVLLLLAQNLMPVISFQLTFVGGVMGNSISWRLEGPIFWIPFVKETVLFLLHILGLSWINWTYMHWFYFWTFCYVPHCYVCLCQYHGILDYYRIVIQLKIRKWDSSCFVFLPQYCLGYSGYFVVSYKF